MILAETVSIDGGALLLILVVLLVLAALWCALMVLGCVWAVRAGRGSRRALTGWVIVSVLEVLPALGGLGTILAVPGLAFLVQVGLYAWARNGVDAGQR